MADFSVRALEIHSQYAWDFQFVKSTIDFMKKQRMNTLVLHKNDFIEAIVFPGKYFGNKHESYDNFYERYQEMFRTLKKLTPTRRNAPLQKRAYFRRLLEETRRAGISVFIENKELYFPDIILELFPQLLKDGKVCPSDPFWWEFIRTKYAEFFEEFPEVGGIITSPASGESRATISYTRCTCERCRTASPEEWYEQLISAIYEPVRKAGRKLIIRDFVFNAKTHNEIGTAMERLPGEIGAALKNTPNDYFPTYPDNARIGNVGKREQWIEFDVWGQFYGWGVAPSILIDDLRNRMNYAKERGAEGVIFRVDWENLDGHTAFDTLNVINLYAGAWLSENLGVDNATVYERWLEQSGHYAPGLGCEDKRRIALWVGSILDRTWDVMKRTAYLNDFVFSDSSHWPVSLDMAHWLAGEVYNIQQWDASKSTNPLSIDENNVRQILAEKDEALRLVNELNDKLMLGNEGIADQAYEWLKQSFAVYIKYVEAFRLVTHSIILSKCAIDGAADRSGAFYAEAQAMAKQKLQEMLKLAEQFDEMFYGDKEYPNRAYTLLDARRLKALYNDLDKHLSAADR